MSRPGDLVIRDHREYNSQGWELVIRGNPATTGQLVLCWGADIEISVTDLDGLTAADICPGVEISLAEIKAEIIAAVPHCADWDWDSAWDDDDEGAV